jgi:hypothetical protein
MSLSLQVVVVGGLSVGHRTSGGRAGDSSVGSGASGESGSLIGGGVEILVICTGRSWSAAMAASAVSMVPGVKASLRQLGSQVW